MNDVFDDMAERQILRDMMDERAEIALTQFNKSFNHVYSQEVAHCVAEAYLFNCSQEAGEILCGLGLTDLDCYAIIGDLDEYLDALDANEKFNNYDINDL